VIDAGNGSALAEHLGIILSILTTVFGAAVFLFWRTFVSVEKKCKEVESLVRGLLLGDSWVKRREQDVFREDVRKELDGLWAAVNELRRGDWNRRFKPKDGEGR